MEKRDELQSGRRANGDFCCGWSVGSPFVDFEAHTQTPGNGSWEALATCPSNDVEIDGKGAETDGLGEDGDLSLR